MSSCWLCSLTFLSFVSQIVCIQNGTQTTSAIRAFGSVCDRWIGRPEYTVPGGCRDSPGHSAHQRGPALENRLLDSISSSPEDVHSDVMLAPGRLTVSCGARPRAACGGPRRDRLHRLDFEPRAHCGGRADTGRPLAPDAPSWPRRCSPEPSHCRLVTRSGRWRRRHRAPSSPASPDGGSWRAGCWAPLECATPRWSRIWAHDRAAPGHIQEKASPWNGPWTSATAGRPLSKSAARWFITPSSISHWRSRHCGFAGRTVRGRARCWLAETECWPFSQTQTPAGALCSSTRPAELITLRAALSDSDVALADQPVIIWLDSRAVLQIDESNLGTDRIWGTSPPNCGGRVPHPRLWRPCMAV